MSKTHVYVNRLNWDVRFYKTMSNGTGFIISEPTEVTLNKQKKKTMYGPRSPLYGTQPGDENECMERHACDCGEFKGKQWEGYTCPKCGTVVRERQSNMKMTGWIVLGLNVCINPLYYQLLEKAIGKTVFNNIVQCNKKVDRDGNICEPSEEELGRSKSSIYDSIGIREFYHRFGEILEHFATTTRKAKADDLRKLINQKRKVFASHIPIYTTKIRSQSLTPDTFYYTKIDTIINTMFTLSENLKVCEEVEYEFTLWKLQTKVNSMWDNIFDQMTGKDGLVRDQLLGAALNYTARNVIIPNNELRDNEVIISYRTFLELFKYKIIQYIMKVEGCVLSKAYTMWKNATTFDKTVYSYMKCLLKEERPRILINRNPTLNFYSILLMKIKDITPDDSNFCLQIPLSIDSI